MLNHVILIKHYVDQTTTIILTNDEGFTDAYRRGSRGGMSSRANELWETIEVLSDRAYFPQIRKIVELVLKGKPHVACGIMRELMEKHEDFPGSVPKIISLIRELNPNVLNSQILRAFMPFYLHEVLQREVVPVLQEYFASGNLLS